ncbi:MAG: DUF924 domain-containing protein [Magnetospirillum sp.]|nr:DUF924 domain-containing protein [Magnetospirillum sp.]
MNRDIKGPHALAAEARRKAAEGEALRANLKRRKLQLRGRAALADEATVAAVLDFWFGDPNDPLRDAFRDSWFKADAAFDQECRERFGALAAEAAQGALARLGDTPEGALALILLLDQMPRNIHRGTPLAFASDEAALSLARRIVARGFDQTLPPVMRLFVYLPFTHAEDLGAQNECVRLVESLPEAPWRARALKSAIAHRDVIVRFGRFAHRNAFLGRTSTADEQAYLAEPGAGF